MIKDFQLITFGNVAALLGMSAPPRRYQCKAAKHLHKGKFSSSRATSISKAIPQSTGPRSSLLLRYSASRPPARARNLRFEYSRRSLGVPRLTRGNCWINSEFVPHSPHRALISPQSETRRSA